MVEDAEIMRKEKVLSSGRERYLKEMFGQMNTTRNSTLNHKDDSLDYSGSVSNRP